MLGLRDFRTYIYIIRKVNKTNIMEKDKVKNRKVIGYTNSDKPIYEKHTHKTHQDFTSEDHIDASELHQKYAQAYHFGPNLSKHNPTSIRFEKKDQAAYNFHQNQSELHYKFARQETKMAKSKD